MLIYSAHRAALQGRHASRSASRLGAAHLSTAASVSTTTDTDKDTSKSASDTDAAAVSSPTPAAPAPMSFAFQSTIKSPFLAGDAEGPSPTTPNFRNGKLKSHVTPRNTKADAPVIQMRAAPRRAAAPAPRTMTRRAAASPAAPEMTRRTAAPASAATSAAVGAASGGSRKTPTVVKMRVRARRETARGVPRFSALVKVMGEKNATSLVCSTCVTVLVDDTSAFHVSEGQRGVHVVSSEPAVFNQIALCDAEEDREWSNTSGGRITRTAKGVCPCCSANFASVAEGPGGKKEMLIKKAAVQLLRKSDSTMSSTKLQWRGLQLSNDTDELIAALRFVPHEPTHSRVVLHKQLLSHMTSIDQILCVFSKSPDEAHDPWNVVVTLNQCVSLLPIVKDEADGHDYVDTAPLLEHPKWKQLEQAVTNIVSRVVPMLGSDNYETPFAPASGIKRSPRLRPLSHLPSEDIAAFAVAVAQTHSTHKIRELTVRYVRKELDVAEGFGAQVKRDMLVLAEEMVEESKPEGWAISRWFSDLLPSIGSSSSSSSSNVIAPLPTMDTTPPEASVSNIPDSEQARVAKSEQVAATVKSALIDNFQMVTSPLPYVLSVPKERIVVVDSAKTLQYAEKCFAQLQANAEKLAKVSGGIASPSTAIAIDAEWMSHGKMAGVNKAAICQVATRSEVFVFDVLKMKQKLQPLLMPLFSNPAILKLGHGLKQDMLVTLTGINAPAATLVFPSCVEVSDVVGTLERPPDGQQLGLSKMLIMSSGQAISKNLQRSKWGSRPLSPDQILYAAADADALFKVFDAFVAESEMVKGERFDLNSVLKDLTLEKEKRK